MISDNLINYLKEIDTGICKICGNPKGHFESEIKYFCYKCQGYELLNREDTNNLIKWNKRRLREEFNKIAIKADIFYCLKAFLSFGETLMLDKNENSIQPNKQAKEKILIVDPRKITIANLGVLWLLEASLKRLPNTVPWNNSYVINMMNLIRMWLEWNKREKLSDPRYNLGFFIIKNDKTLFYYTKQFDFYLDSLSKFHIISSYEVISENMAEKIKRENNNLFQNPIVLKKYVMDEYPASISTILNAYYTDEVNRPYSFDYLLDQDNRIFTQFCSKLNSSIREHLESKKTRFPELILALLEHIYSFYDNKRSKFLNEIGEDGLVVVRDLSQLTEDIVKEKLLIPPFKEYIVCSNRNITRYPFIIEYNGKFIISPTRLWIGYRLLHYALQKDRINSELAIKYENKALNQIEKSLNRYGVKFVGRGIKSKRQGRFEIDLIGYYKNYILVIESKSFHPSPFFMMRKNRRYINQFKIKFKKIEIIKNWLFTNLAIKKAIEGKIRIRVFDNYNNKQSEIIFPEKYANVKFEDIIFIYVTQIKEFFKIERDDFIQVWSGDL